MSDRSPMKKPTFGTEENPVNDDSEEGSAKAALHRTRSRSANERSKTINSSITPPPNLTIQGLVGRTLNNSGGSLSSRQSVVGTVDHFTVEHSQPRLDNLSLDITDDQYTLNFRDVDHYNFVATRGDSPTCVVTVMKEVSPMCPQLDNFSDVDGGHKCLFTNRDGMEEFFVSRWGIHKNGNECTGTLVDHFLQKCNPEPSSITFQRLGDEFPQDFTNFARQTIKPVSHLKIGVLYVQQGQMNISDIFANQPPPGSGFWNFMDKIARNVNLAGWKNYLGDFGQVEQDSYYTTWKDIEIMFHVAPWLTKEQHRQLIGNDMCFIIYYDNPTEPLDPIAMDALGTVPQVFTVVQPAKTTGFYRLGFFRRSNLKPFPPHAPPRDHEFNAGTLRDYLFTKLHNGYVMSTKCPPMNRLFSTPRAAALKELLTKPKITTKDKKKKNKDEKKKLVVTNTGAPAGQGPKGHRNSVAKKPTPTMRSLPCNFTVSTPSNEEVIVEITDASTKLQQILQNVCGAKNLDLTKLVSKDKNRKVVPDETPVIYIEGGSISIKSRHPFIDEFIEHFSAEEPHTELETPIQVVVKYPYLEDFNERDHVGFLGMKDEKCECVIVLLKVPESDNHLNVHKVIDTGPTYRALLVDKTGQHELRVNSVMFGSRDCRDMPSALLELINRNARPGFHLERVPNSGMVQLSKALTEIEKKFTHSIQSMKMLVVVSNSGQKTLGQMMENKVTQGEDHVFNSFIKGISHGELTKEGEDHCTTWKGVKICMTMIPWSSTAIDEAKGVLGEQGLVVAFLNSKEEGAMLAANFSEPNLPQIVAVVQPTDSGKFRLGFLNRQSIKPYPPRAPPAKEEFELPTLRDYLFTKLHNGILSVGPEHSLSNSKPAILNELKGFLKS